MSFWAYTFEDKPGYIQEIIAADVEAARLILPLSQWCSYEGDTYEPGILARPRLLHRKAYRGPAIPSGWMARDADNYLVRRAEAGSTARTNLRFTLNGWTFWAW